MSFVDALKSEIAALERQLEADPTYIKLRETKRLLATYSSPGAVASAAGHSSSKTYVRGVGAYTRPATSGVSGTVVATAREVLKGRMRPTSTKEIMAILGDFGVEIGGKNPQNVVSSLLSKSPDFISHGRSGWTLATDSHETEKADDADPVRDTSSALFESGPSQSAYTPAQGREAGPGGGT